ncbi:carotenoid oxygenase family protein [Streptomyces winkii]|uniref:carotenoid oxygenase family protein n=1 Tax=Streptomyces winkii TaxID=3051178 RepID=UPI0028D78061|nr:carotenoid oxygenase family protein [Streptomyces sp. DSM 40971]
MNTGTSEGFAAGFRSLDDEVSVEDLPVKGELPGWLNGTLLRNGPAKFEAGDAAFRHWFDGQAMLHRFAVADGRVSYANRFVDTPSSRAVRESGRIGFPEFATDPCRSLFARVFTRFAGGGPSVQNPNVSVARMGERYVALTETPLPVEFDPETLATVGAVTYDDSLAGQTATAHPHQDPVSGDLLNQMTRFARHSEYRVYRQRQPGTARELLGRHPVERPGYMHSFGVSERYVVLAEFPIVVNPLSLLLSGRPFIENYRWQPERGARFIVFDRREGGVRGVYETEAFFAFHHINAWDDGGDGTDGEDGQELVVDLCAYDDASIIDALYLDRLRAGSGPPYARPVRYRIDLSGGGVEREVLSDAAMELPRIDYERCNGRPYRFAYGVGLRDGRDAGFPDQLVKLDTRTRAVRTWAEDGCYPGEPVFVAAPDAAEEDEGVVLSVVLDSAAGSSFLLALDARTFGVLARSHVPHAIPFGFHGLFTGGGGRR